MSNILLKRTFNIHTKKRGWAIVIITDKIPINNYEHGSAHIHTKRKKIKTQELEETFNIIIRYIKKYDEVNIKELREELII